MRASWLLWAWLGTVAWGQASGPASSPAPEVPLDATVLTIKGLCPDRQTAAQSGCETTITRAQFEAIAAAIQPTMNSVVKRQLASLYPRLLVMSHEAETEGLDKDPQYQQMMAYARMQILTQALTRRVQEQAAKLEESDLVDYYQKHLELFQLYGLQRLLVPLRKQSPEGDRGKSGEKTPAESAQEQAARQAGESAELTKLAETIRARAAAGEDLLTLQKEAFKAAGVKVESPNTDMGEVRRTSIPAAHLPALDMRVGEVSPVISDAGGHYVYKLEAKKQLTLDQVKDEVRGILISDRMKEAMDRIQHSYTTETNESYFQPAGNEGTGRRARNPDSEKR
jgi:hypothetical protein